jgi:hypothetical protein
MIKPNLIFNYWRADEVAECMEGVSDTDLYATLWRDIVPLQSEEAKYWHLLSETDQALLNELDDYWHLHASGQAVCLL